MSTDGHGDCAHTVSCSELRAPQPAVHLSPEITMHPPTHAQLRAGLVLAALVGLAACTETALTPRAPERALAPSLSLAAPSPVVEEVTVCKDGSSASFTASNGSSFSLNDGECVLVDKHLPGQPGRDITITEDVPSGTVLDSIVASGTHAARQLVVGPNSITVHFGNDQGWVIVFYNRVLPPPPSGQIGDFVWSDDNNNGIQDAGEAGLAGLTVTLGGDASATTTTDANGLYLFTGLSAGNYTVTVGTPNGYGVSPSFQGGDPNKDSNGSPASVSLPTNSSSDLSIDFGFVPQVCTPTNNPSNFNGTPIAPGNTIWFNSIFKPKGVPASGGTVNFKSASIAITSGGNHYTVHVPNARITFSPAASSASTTYDVGTDTWITVVPVSYTGNIFLSGVGYVPPGGLPGGANPVTWSGQVTTNMSGFSMQWQWAAAVYTSFGALGSIGVKPIDGNTMNPYANSDHAGTPESFKAFVVGGARGGGGSNWTGSYSGTVTPPVCVF
jgi:SdrD B-like protein